LHDPFLEAFVGFAFEIGRELRVSMEEPDQRHHSDPPGFINQLLEDVTAAGWVDAIR